MMLGLSCRRGHTQQVESGWGDGRCHPRC
jgi:hypothetical protein